MVGRAGAEPEGTPTHGASSQFSGLQRLVRANCYVALGLTCCNGVLRVFAQVIAVEATPGGRKKYAPELGGRLPNAYGLS
jgi:hypothetical protein